MAENGIPWKNQIFQSQRLSKAAELETISIILGIPGSSKIPNAHV